MGTFDHFDPEDNVTSFQDAIAKGYGFNPQTKRVEKQQKAEGNLNVRLLPHYKDIWHDFFGPPTKGYNSEQGLETWFNGNQDSLKGIMSDGRWFDQEANVGGYIFGLIMHPHKDKAVFPEGCTAKEAFAWLEEKEYLKSNVTGISSEYVYRAADGAPWQKVIIVRYPNGSKRPTQFHWDVETQDWVKGLDVWDSQLQKKVKIVQVLYHLPELNKAIEAGQRIFITEGEKCADGVIALGAFATTNPEGARKWGIKETHFTNLLQGAKQVIILPDNDEAGVSHARKVAHALTGVVPDIRILPLPGLKEKDDVNEWINDYGGTLDKLNELADAAPEWDDSSYQEIEWADLLLTNKNGVIPNEYNARVILSHHPDTKELLRCNDFSTVIVMERKPVWWPEDQPFRLPHPIEDTDITDILTWLQEINRGFSMEHRRLVRVVSNVARLNGFNPVLDFIHECHAKWIANGRISLLSGDALRETTNKIFPGYIAQMVPDNKNVQRDLVPICFRNTLGTLVYRVHKPGCQVDTLLVLVGGQGFNKGKVGRVLVPEGLYAYQLSKFEHRENLAREMLSKWVGELSEMSNARKGDLEPMKASITAAVDTIVPKYSNYPADIKRNWIFIGTSNTVGILRDHENRRFWIIELTQPINIAWLTEHRDELIGEAYEIFCVQGEKYHFDDDDPNDWRAKGLRSINKHYTEKLPRQDLIAEYVSGLDEVSLDAIKYLLLTRWSYNSNTGWSLNTDVERNQRSLGVAHMEMLGWKRKDRGTVISALDGQKSKVAIYVRGDLPKYAGSNTEKNPMKFLMDKLLNGNAINDNSF
jgi:predicted P-loop ATPase